MKILPNELVRKGFKYSLIERGSQALIYSKKSLSGNIYFEVFQIKIRPVSFIKNITIPRSERFPHDEAFGYWAWSFYSLLKAKKKFTFLNQA